MDRFNISKKQLVLYALVFAPGLVFAQGIGEELDTSRIGPSSAIPAWNNSIVRSALANPIDATTIHSRLSNLKGDETNVTRGAREAQIYSSLSPAVVLVFTGEGLGSGSLLDKHGTILTNWHVIEGYETVRVIFKPRNEGEQFSVNSAVLADVIRIDEVADLALLRAKAVPAGVTPIPLGSMNEASIGSDVHAIGHPTGESWTYTRGFVSQFRKDYEWFTESGVDHKGDVIQTQTPINPGNSGGPLLSSNGNLIGVNSFKASGEALNFAVSVDEVRRFISMKADRLASRKKDVCGEEPIDSFRDEDRGASIALFDIDCDGEVDGRLLVSDDPNEPFIFSVDRSGDGQIDQMLIDEDRDGNVDYELVDVNGNGEPDIKGYYRNGEDEPYKIEKYSG